MCSSRYDCHVRGSVSSRRRSCCDDRAAHRAGDRVRIAAGSDRPSERRAELRVAVGKEHPLLAVVHHRRVALMLDDADDFECLGLVA